MLKGDWFERWKMSWTHFPDETQCPNCKLFAITDDVIDQIIETSGGSDARVRMRLEASRCICNPPHLIKPPELRLPYKDE